LGIWAASDRPYKAPPRPETGGAEQAAQRTWNEELLPFAIDKFNRLEELVEPEGLGQTIDQFTQWIEGQGRVSSQFMDQLDQWIQGHMFNQAIDQLEQWVQGQRPLEGWQLDPMVAATARLVSEIPELKNAGKLSFARADICTLHEAVLLRDASNWARGEQVDDLQRAKQLFDWTVRNIQLVDLRMQPIRQRPYETLLLGSGTLLDRAWVFILMARQQGLDAVMLGLYDRSDRTKTEISQWIPAVLIEQKLYLFDPNLGLPIPARGGIRRDEAGRLDIQPATLEQAAADEAILRQLDIDEAHPYPVKADDLKHVVAMIEASPACLTQRMRMVEMRLAGKDKMVLTTSPSALAARLKQCAHINEVRLWDAPYQLLAQRMQLRPAVAQWQARMQMPFYAGRAPYLMKGRILYLRGRHTGEPNAAEMYQLARPAGREIDTAKMPPHIQAVYQVAKMHASYWLGLLAMEQGNYRAAIDYFTRRVLEATPGGPWTHGAKYNLGRVYEALRQPEKAWKEYESDVTSPGLYGNLLRARWLGSKTAKVPKAFSRGGQSKEANPPSKAAGRPTN